ncbi:MAG: hypothetical protein ACRDSR_20130 [Pseudonocardiaceae bacterium]
MTWWEYALWGALGGLVVEATQFYWVIRRCKVWPWEVKGEPALPVYAASVVIRVGLGIAVASVMGKAGAISDVLGIFGAGVSAPLIIEQILKQRQVPRSDDRDPSGAR